MTGANGNEGPPVVDASPDVPPIMGTWPRLYAFVLGSQAVIITLLWLMSKAFE